MGTDPGKCLPTSKKRLLLTTRKKKVSGMGGRLGHRVALIFGFENKTETWSCSKVTKCWERWFESHSLSATGAHWRWELLVQRQELRLLGCCGDALFKGGSL